MENNSLQLKYYVYEVLTNQQIYYTTMYVYQINKFTNYSIEISKINDSKHNLVCNSKIMSQTC